MVDDGSRDATAQIARSSPVVTTVVDGGGAGPARARNAGAERASGERLAFLDSDCEPTPGWLAAGIGRPRRRRARPGRGAAAPGVAGGPVRPHAVGDGRLGPLRERQPVRPEGDLRGGGRLSELAEPAPRDRAGRGRLARAGACAASGAPTGFCADALAYHEVFPRARAPTSPSGPACASSPPWRPGSPSCARTSSGAGSSSTGAAPCSTSPWPGRWPRPPAGRRCRCLAAAPYAREAYRHARRRGRGPAAPRGGRGRRRRRRRRSRRAPGGQRARSQPPRARTSRAGGSRRASRRASPHGRDDDPEDRVGSSWPAHLRREGRRSSPRCSRSTWPAGRRC